MGSASLWLSHFTDVSFLSFSVFLPNDVGSGNLWLSYSTYVSFLFFIVFLLNNEGSRNLWLSHFTDVSPLFFSVFLPNDVGSANLWLSHFTDISSLFYSVFSPMMWVLLTCGLRLQNNLTIIYLFFINGNLSTVIILMFPLFFNLSVDGIVWALDFGCL